MSEGKVYEVPASFASTALINQEQYKSMYERSLSDPDGFWAEQANELLDWYKPWDKVQDWDFNEANIRWFEGAKLNVCYNCLDRHLETQGEKTALIWEGDDSSMDIEITYRNLYEQVCRFANALKGRGV